jgi:polyisoprenoid-binding protein YceI
MTTQEQTALPTGTWNADPVHSTIAFAIDYMAGTFQGSFSKFEAQVADGTLRGAAEVASISVKDPNLEAHLQGPDFFDAERNPQLTFEASDVQRAGDDLTINGQITMKGHTEPIEIRGTVTDPFDDPFGNERFGIKLEAKVDRTRFGINWNNPLPSGEPALSNEVTLIGDVQFVREA